MPYNRYVDKLFFAWSIKTCVSKTVIGTAASFNSHAQEEPAGLYFSQAAYNYYTESIKKCLLMKPVLTLSLLLFLFSCTPESNRPTQGTIDAYVPVYATATDLTQISIEAPRPIAQAGKIYAYGNYIFQNDLNAGIHIIDNTNRTSPQKISFVKLPFSTEIAVKGNYLYSNNYKDLVVFDISNPASPRFVKRIADVFPPVNQKFPPFTNVYFECPDEAKGVVIRWELKRINTPNCRR